MCRIAIGAAARINRRTEALVTPTNKVARARAGAGNGLAGIFVMAVRAAAVKNLAKAWAASEKAWAKAPLGQVRKSAARSSTPLLPKPVVRQARSFEC